MKNFGAAFGGQPCSQGALAPMHMPKNWGLLRRLECGRGASRSACTGTHSGEGRIVMRPYAHTDKLEFTQFLLLHFQH